MKLIFKNSKGEERIVAVPNSEESALEFIHAFCEERGFIIYYVRTWREGERKWFDVGSHTEFFILQND